MTLPKLLDALKRALKVESDYALAVRMNWRKETVSKYRHEQRVIGNHHLYEAAEVLKRDPGALRAEIEATYADTEKEKRFWERWTARAAAVLLAAGLSGQAAEFDKTQANAQSDSPEAVRNTHC